MKLRFIVLCAAFTLMPLIAPSAADISINAEMDGIEMDTPSKARSDTKKDSSASCAAQCSSAHAKCGSEVRRARQQCSRTAATAGHEVFDTYHDSSIFCSYFRRPRDCGPGCEARFAQHFRLCMKAVDNPARMRQDCMEQERQAQSFCRQELHACELGCRS